MFTPQQQSLRTLKASYVSAFIIVILLATLTQGVIQFSLNQETALRAAAENFGQEAELSQRLERNSLFFLAPGNQDAHAHQMQIDLAALKARAMSVKTNFLPLVPKLSTFPPSARVTYNTVNSDVEQMVTVELAHLPEKQREKAIYPLITNMFYQEENQLNNINLARSYVDQTTDDYISHIRLTELVLYALNILVWVFELIMVLIPALRRFTLDLTLPTVFSSSTSSTVSFSSSSSSSSSNSSSSSDTSSSNSADSSDSPTLSPFLPSS